MNEVKERKKLKKVQFSSVTQLCLTLCIDDDKVKSEIKI